MHVCLYHRARFELDPAVHRGKSCRPHVRTYARPRVRNARDTGLYADRTLRCTVQLEADECTTTRRSGGNWHHTRRSGFQSYVLEFRSCLATLPFQNLQLSRARRKARFVTSGSGRISSTVICSYVGRLPASGKRYVHGGTVKRSIARYQQTRISNSVRKEFVHFEKLENMKACSKTTR